MRNKNANAWAIANDLQELASSVKDDAKAGEVDCALEHIAAMRTILPALEDELRNGNLHTDDQWNQEMEEKER